MGESVKLYALEQMLMNVMERGSNKLERRLEEIKKQKQEQEEATKMNSEMKYTRKEPETK